MSICAVELLENKQERILRTEREEKNFRLFDANLAAQYMLKLMLRELLLVLSCVCVCVCVDMSWLWRRRG